MVIFHSSIPVILSQIKNKGGGKLNTKSVCWCSGFEGLGTSTSFKGKHALKLPDMCNNSMKILHRSFSGKKRNPLK